MIFVCVHFFVGKIFYSFPYGVCVFSVIPVSIKM